MPLAGSGPSAAESYDSQSYQEADRGYRQRRPYNGSSGRGDGGQTQRGSQADRQRRRNMQQRRGRDGYGAADRLMTDDMRTSDYSYDGRGGLYRRDEVSMRNIVPREYTDDMRFDEQARPYERASTISGRRSSRNIANMERPNVRRRDAGARNGARGRGSSGSRGRNDKGGNGFSRFFSDPQRAIFGIVLILAVVLTAILVFSVSSCVNGKNTTSSPKSVSVSSADQSSGSTTATTNTSTPTSSKSTSSSSSSSSSSQKSTTESSASTYTPTVVKVSVESGAYTWLEITSDGVSDVAESVTGPWEREYTVTDSISVQAGDPSSVSVTKNGESVSFTSKASGLGSLSVKGTKAPETTTEDSSSSGQADSQSAEESSSNQ